jgi:hypothetical protein
MLTDKTFKNLAVRLLVSLLASCSASPSYAIALANLWWRGDENKLFIRQILSAIAVVILNIPVALTLGEIIVLSLPVRKVHSND